MSINNISNVLTGTMSGYIPRLIETKDKYVVYGHVYDKYKLTAEPFNFLVTQATANCDMIIDRMRRVPTKLNDSGKYVEKSCISDNLDPTIEYIISPQLYIGATYYNGYKIQKRDDGSYKVLWSANVMNNTAQDLEYVTQDNNYLYFMNVHYLSTAIYFIRTNKTTGVSEWLTVHGYQNVYGKFNPTIVNNKIYGFYLQNATWKFTMCTIDLTAWAVTTTVLGTLVSTSTYNMAMVPMYKNGMFICYNTWANGKVYKHTYNPTTTAYTETEVATLTLPYTTDTAGNAYHITAMLPILDGKKLLLIQRNGMGNLVADARIHMFTINQTDFTLSDMFVYKNPVPFKTHMVHAEDNKIFLISTNTISTVGMSLVDAPNELIHVETIPVADVDLFGMDRMFNIIIQNTAGQLIVMNKKTPVVITASLGGKYSYEGTDVNGTLSIKITNHRLENVSCNAQLTLAGNMTFSDGTKSKTVSINGTSTLPIIITGYGKVECGVNIV